MKGLTLTVILLVTAAVAAALVYIVLHNSKSAREGFSDDASAGVDSQCVFDEVRGASSTRVVLYYADWCGHCKAFKPEFDRAAEAARKEGLDVAFVKVNSDKQARGSTCLTYKGVSGFPTVQLERVGTSPPFVVYGGPRKAEALLQWAREA